jgi:hypothetical protein
MTQTLNQPVAQHAMVISHHALGVTRLHRFPVASVEEARDEFGGTLADALLFVDGVQCVECATEATETRDHAAVPRQCLSCGTAGCACIVVEDDHSRDTFFCLDCLPLCNRSCCTD